MAVHLEDHRSYSLIAKFGQSDCVYPGQMWTAMASSVRKTLTCWLNASPFTKDTVSPLVRPGWLFVQYLSCCWSTGKFEKDVVDRWRAIVGGWWTNFTGAADANRVYLVLANAFEKQGGSFSVLQDKSITFEEWIAFFKNLAATTKSHNELPEFLKMYLKVSAPHLRHLSSFKRHSPSSFADLLYLHRFQQ